jgi:hypothetical protein
MDTLVLYLDEDVGRLMVGENSKELHSPPRYGSIELNIPSELRPLITLIRVIEDKHGPHEKRFLACIAQGGDPRVRDSSFKDTGFMLVVVRRGDALERIRLLPVAEAEEFRSPKGCRSRKVPFLMFLGEANAFQTVVAFNPRFLPFAEALLTATVRRLDEAGVKA